MKKLVLLLLVVSSVAFTSCSKDNDDVDAIIGIWANESSFTVGEETTENRDEWDFKEDNTGVFTEFYNGAEEESYTFTWSKSGDTYTLVIDNSTASETYTIGNLLGNKTLEDSEGYTVAIKE